MRPRAAPADQQVAGWLRGDAERGDRSDRERIILAHLDLADRLADPATHLRPTAARVLKALRADGPRTAEELVAALANLAMCRYQPGQRRTSSHPVQPAAAGAAS